MLEFILTQHNKEKDECNAKNKEKNKVYYNSGFHQSQS
jgi:hypothetical protein